MKLYLVQLLITFSYVGISTPFPLSDETILKYAPMVAQFLGLPKPIPEIMEEAFLEATNLIERYGYPAENHSLTTDDGYNLIHHRIPHGKNGKQNESAIPVLLVHGMNCESTQWFDNGPESLAFVLADEGYDVWLANTRGTSYSNHSTLTRKDDVFWNFNLQDIADNDVRPLIDYVLKKTGFSKLLYVGQSMGTALSFFLLADKPEYNKKIAGNIAIAPVLSFKYLTTIQRLMFKIPDEIQFLTNTFNAHSWLSISPLSRKLSMYFCPSANPSFCERSMNFVTGYDPYLRNKTRVPIYGTHCSAGSSVNLFIHGGQMMRDKKFSKFDYGKVKNLKRYGSETAPQLFASNILAPIILIHGANDVLASPLDVELTKRALPNVVEKYLLPNPLVSHTDYMFAKNGKEFLYDKIVVYLKQLWNMSN